MSFAPAFPVNHNLEINDQEFELLIADSKKILADDSNFTRKYRGKNYFKQLTPELKDRVTKIVSALPEFQNLRWHFEVFYSVESVGFHNDRNHFPKLNERCDRGLIIPLEWVGLTPKTNYLDLFFEDKVNWTGKAFKTLEGEYKPHEALKLKEGAAETAWEKKKVIFFDARQIHEASPFAVKPEDYKLSINGLGYAPFL